MVSSPALIEVISERLRFYQAKHIVVDPVLVATSGSALASGGVPDLMKKLLFPLAEVITPNIPEGEVLSGIKIQSERRYGTRRKRDRGFLRLCRSIKGRPQYQ